MAALFFQWHFNRRQALIAQDKLKFDLFKERYAIYSAAGELIEFVNSSKERPGEEHKFTELMNELMKAHFFFDETTCKELAPEFWTVR